MSSYPGCEDWKEYRDRLHPYDIEVIELFDKGGGHRSIARKLGVSQSGITQRLQKLAKRLVVFRKMPKISKADLDGWLAHLTIRNRGLVIRWAWNMVSQNELSLQHGLSQVTVRRVCNQTVDQVKKNLVLSKYLQYRIKHSSTLQSFSLRQCRHQKITTSSQMTTLPTGKINGVGSVHHIH